LKARNPHQHWYWLTVEQQFIPALAITCPVKRERRPLAPSLKKSRTIMRKIAKLFLLTSLIFSSCSSKQDRISSSVKKDRIIISVKQDSISSSVKQNRFKFIDYYVVLQDLNSNGQNSAYYKDIDYEAMLWLDTNCIPIIRKANPDFIAQSNINIEEYRVSSNSKTNDWTWELEVNLKGIKSLFNDKSIFDKIYSSINRGYIDYSTIYNTIYFKNDTAIFTCIHPTSSETYRVTLKGSKQKLEILENIIE
jgi:hypothetical protein